MSFSMSNDAEAVFNDKKCGLFIYKGGHKKKTKKKQVHLCLSERGGDSCFGEAAEGRALLGRRRFGSCTVLA